MSPYLREFNDLGWEKQRMQNSLLVGGRNPPIGIGFRNEFSRGMSFFLLLLLLLIFVAERGGGWRSEATLS